MTRRGRDGGRWDGLARRCLRQKFPVITGWRPYGHPWTRFMGFQGPSALGGDQKGQRPIGLIRSPYQ